MKVFEITKMKLKYSVRNLKSTAIVFIIPIVFMSIFGLVFGRNANSISFDIAILSSSNQDYNQIASMIERISDEEEDLTINFIEAENYDKGKDLVVNNEANLLMNWDEASHEVQIYTKPQDQMSAVYTGILRQITDGYFQVESTKLVQKEIEIETEDSAITPYQILTPGLLVYGIMILMPLAASDFANITEKKEIFRFFTSKAKSRDILSGYFLYLTIFAIIQFLLMLYVATMFGFSASGSPFVPFLVIGVPMIFFTVGVGLLIGSTTENSEAASNLGTMVSLVLAFFSGTFISGIDTIFTFNIGENIIRLTDILPPYHATEAMKSMMLYGQPITAVLDRSLFLIVTSLIIFIIGVVLFKKNRLTRLG